MCFCDIYAVRACLLFLAMTSHSSPKWHQHGELHPNVSYHVVAVGHDYGTLALFFVADALNNRAFLAKMFRRYISDSIGSTIRCSASTSAMRH